MRKGIAVFAFAAGIGLAMGAGLSAAAEGRPRIVLADMLGIPQADGHRWEFVDLGSCEDPASVRRVPIELEELRLDRSTAEKRAALYGDRLVVYSRAGGTASTKDELRVYRVRDDLSVELEKRIPIYTGNDQRAAFESRPFDRPYVFFFPARIWVIAETYIGGVGFVASAWKVDDAGLIEPLTESAYGPARPASADYDWARDALIPPLLVAYRGDETALAKGFASLQALFAGLDPSGLSKLSVKPRDRTVLVHPQYQSPGRLFDFATGESREIPSGQKGEDRSLLFTDSYFEFARAQLSRVGGKDYLFYAASSYLSVYDMEYPLYPRRVAYDKLPSSGEEYWMVVGGFEGGLLLASTSGALAPYLVGADGSCRPAWDGAALLAEAIAAGDAKRTLALCAAGVDPRAAGAGGRPLWLGAIAAEKQTVLDALLGYLDQRYGAAGGGSSDVPGYWIQASPVRYAISIGKPGAAIALARRMPKALASGPDATALFDAAGRGDTALCGALLDAGVPPGLAFRSGASWGNALAYAKDAETRAYLVKRGVPETIEIEKGQALYGQAGGLVLRAGPSAQAAVVARGGVDFNGSQFSLLASRATVEPIDGAMGRWIKVRPQGSGVEGWAASYRFMHSYDDGP